ncbi:MFS transporter [Hyphomicrobium sp.]|uniref:MFS transporter n=1 Tax=Hyphomicrobium sp. TaxID=82 RepID=UPI0025BB2BE5|nr:MFS transporter [Hyphomicrobium sp.]
MQVSRAAWTIVGLLWVVCLLSYLDRQLVAAMPGPIKADLKLGDEKFGLLSSVFLWIYGFCSPVAGYIADRVSKRLIIVVSLLIWSAATFLSGLATSFEGMLFARATLGVSEAFYMPAAVSLIVAYHRGPTRSRATGLHLSGVYVGSIIGGLGGAMAEAFGWRLVFLVIGALGVAYAFVLMVLFPQRTAEIDPASPEDAAPLFPDGGTMRSLLSKRSFLLLLGMNLLNGAAYWPVRNWIAEFFRAEIGVSSAWAGVYGPMTFNGAAFLGMLVASNLSDWWMARNVRARSLVPAFGFLIAAPFLFILGASDYIPLVLMCLIVTGMSQGFLDANLMPATCTVVDPRCRAAAYGLLNFAGTTAGGGMTFVGGWLKEQHIPFSATFQAASGLILLAGLLLLFVRPPANARSLVNAGLNGK